MTPEQIDNIFPHGYKGNATISDLRLVMTKVNNEGGTGGATKLDDLTDVDTTTTAPTSGQVLTWDGVQSWTPTDTSAGGGTESELEKITEGTNTGWRLLGMDATIFGDIGQGAVDFSSGAGKPSENFGAIGNFSFAEGYSATASGMASHAEGYMTIASGSYGSHAEGYDTEASGYGAHAEGYDTAASGDYGSHSEGYSSVASGEIAHAEGYSTTASGKASHTEGYSTTASGETAHTEGMYTTATGKGAHAEGSNSIASGEFSHAEGSQSQSEGDSSHAEGYMTYSTGNNSHSEGNGTRAVGINSHTEGTGTIALNEASHAAGRYNIGTATDTIHETGIGTGSRDQKNAFEIYTDGTLVAPECLNINIDAKGDKALVTREYLQANTGDPELVKFTEGSHTGWALKCRLDYSTHYGDIGQGAVDFSASEGTGDYGATGKFSFATGFQVTAEGNYGSFACGEYTEASGTYSHAEGRSTTASGDYGAHAEGIDTTASGRSSHAEGSQTKASGSYSHAEGRGTISQNNEMHATGKYNVGTATDTIHETGIGADDANRANAFEIYTDGTLTAPECTLASIGTRGAKALVTKEYVDANGTTVGRPAAPTKGQNYLDLDLGIPIWFNGTNWIDATGTIV